MIFGSALLVLVAIALLGAGTYRDSGSLYYSSIVTSVLAAGALIGGLRQARVRLAFDDDFDLGGVREPEPWPGGDPISIEAPVDEPAERVLSAAELDAVTVSATPVAVVDGRPRFHRPGCLHLLGRRVDHLPAAEALDAGFTACAHCWLDS